MSTFSERYGYDEKPLQYETMSKELRNRIRNIYQCEVVTDVIGYDSHYLEELMDFFGLSYSNIYDNFSLTSNLNVFHNWFLQAKWYKIYDFIEAYLNFISTNERKDAIENFNKVLTWENAGYRVCETKVIPITNKQELSCIESAQKTAYESVNIHLKKATEFFAKRPTPDYENSIKESISAIESICCIITENNNATLGESLKKLESKGVRLHKAFQNAMNSLYGYTSDESVIRHGGIDFIEVSREDAKYVFISCSAFVNYLIEKC